MKGLNKVEGAQEARKKNAFLQKTENMQVNNADNSSFEDEKSKEKNKDNEVNNGFDKDTLLVSEEEVEDIDVEFPESYGKEEVEAIKAYAKSLKLSKEQAMGLSKLSKQLEENSRKKQVEQLKDWEVELKNDKDVGGKNFAKNIEYAKIALQKYDTDNALRTLLNESGYGSHPIVVKFFVALGKKMNEDSFVHGENAKKNKPLYERLYN